MKLIFLFIFSFFFINQIQAIEVIVASCSIFDLNGNLLRKYTGSECIFFSDGTMLRTNEVSIEYLSKDMNVIWSKKMHTHHQLNLSFNRKNVLVMSSHEKKFLGSQVRFDLLKLIEIRTGTILYEFDFYKHRLELIKNSNSNYILKKAKWGDGLYLLSELTHANSFREIEDNHLQSKHKAFAKGHYIISGHFIGEFIIADKTLSQILWTKGFSDLAHGFHDVQVLQNGHFQFYHNYKKNEDGSFNSSIDEVDPLAEKLVSRFEPVLDGEKIFTPVRGGQQNLKDGLLMSGLSKTNGFQILKYDKHKNLKLRFTPFPNARTGYGEDFQQPSQVDIGSFMKNNSGGF